MKVASNNMTIADYTMAETDEDSEFFKKSLSDLDKLVESWERTQAIKNIEFVGNINPYRAADLNEEYVRTYPDDYIAVAHYISSIIVVNELDAAEKELKYLVDIFNAKYKELSRGYPIQYEYLPEDLKKLSNNIALSTLKLYCCQRHYGKALEYYGKHWRSFKKYAAHILFYIECQNNIHNKDITSDLYRLLANYDEELFKKAVLKKQEEQGNYTTSNKPSYFYRDFPFEKVYEEVKKCLPVSDGLYLGLIETTYIFRCENCGVYKGENADFFKVVVLNGTFDVIDMAPIQKYYGLPEYYDFTDFVKGGNVKSIVR